MTDRSVSLLERAITSYRQELLSLDEAAVRRMIALYAPVRAGLLEAVAALEAQLVTAGDLSIADALRLDRAQELLRQTEIELARLAPQAEAQIAAYRQRALTLAADHAQGLTLVSAAQGGPQAYASARAGWTRLNTGAVEQILGRLSDGAPLRLTIASYGADAGKHVAATLSQQIAIGTHPRGIAQLLAKQAVGVPASRLLALARTEALSAYRGATVETYRANADILDGFIWTAGRSGSCLACLAMDGTRFPLESSFAKQHVNCRCSYRPSIKGIDGDAVPSGADWFYSQPKAAQVRMVLRSTRSQTAADDFAAGRVALEDFVAVDRSEQWGESHRVGSTAQARRNAERRERRAA